jgi:hypothetical protein
LQTRGAEVFLFYAEARSEKKLVSTRDVQPAGEAVREFDNSSGTVSVPSGGAENRLLIVAKTVVQSCAEIYRFRNCTENVPEGHSKNSADTPTPTTTNLSTQPVIQRMEPTTRLELVTCRLRIGCSTN